MLSRKVMSGGAPVDPYFKNVTLLLHGDGTNGGQNNTFIDGSSNNFTITRNGNTTQGSFNPYGSLWSNYFDGTGDYIDAPSGGAISGTGNFTVECWLYPSTISSGYKVVYANVTNNGFSFSLNSTGTLGYGRSNVATDGTTTGVLTFNAWNHIAWVRSGTGSNQFVCYINGVSAGTFTNSTSYASGTVRIGVDGNGSSFPYQGYISNLRVNTTAVYSADFTPPTTNLTAISNTSLLTCQSNRFIDNSTNNFTITRNGDTKVTSFAPFAPTRTYEASQGASGYFDGAGDYLVKTNESNLNLGTGDYTFECWVYPLGATIYKGIFGKRASNVGWTMFLSNASPAYMGFYYNGGGNNIATSGPVVTGMWSHLAWVKNSGTVYYYVNGVQVHNIATGPGDNSYDTTLGVSQNVGVVSEFFDGYISDARFVKGTAVYTAAFTPPTSPLTAITNTQLLCNFKNAAIFDSAAKNDLETVGNAQIDTATKKFGTGSLEFDGTGDWLLLPDNPDLQLGTGNLTVEFWVYLATGDAGSNRGLVSKGTASTGWSVSLNTTQKVVFSYASSTITSSGAITLDAWNHIAVVREGTGSNQTKIYIGGTNDGTGTVSTDFNQTNVMYVGANRAAGDPMKGFIDDVRITKGVARYTANFTPPTLPFPNK